MSNEKFPDSSNLDAWKKAATKSAPGGNIDALNWNTSEGIAVKPLYTKADVADLPYTDTLPGLAPYVRGPLGSFATYKLRLNASAVNTRRSIAGDSTSSGAVAAIDSAGAGSLLGWGLLASSDRSSFRRGRTTVNERVQARLSLSPDPELRLALRGGQETTDAITVDKQRYANWGFDAQWTPNERTQASLTTDRRYFGQSHQWTLAGCAGSSFTTSARYR